MGILNWFIKPKKKDDKLTLAIEDFRAINKNSFNSVYSSDKSILQLYSCVATIIEYIELLKKLKNSIEHEVDLIAIEIPQSANLIYIRDFFLDKQRRFIDPVETIDLFINEVIEFLELYKLKVNKSDSSFTVERNLRLSQYITSNLITLSKELRRV